MILLKVLNNLNSDEDYYEYENEDLIIYNDIKKDLEVTDKKLNCLVIDNVDSNSFFKLLKEKISLLP